MCANHTLKESSDIKAGDHTSIGDGSEETGDTAQWEVSCFLFPGGGRRGY